LSQPLAALERLIGPLHAVEALVERLLRQRAVTQPVQRRVVGDPVEPGAQLELGVVAADRLVGVDEGLLDGVLGALARQYPPDVAGERAPVTLDDRLERRLVARADQVHEALVGLAREHRLAAEARGMEKRPGGHGCEGGPNL
jgi:hypothetical protein